MATADRRRADEEASGSEEVVRTLRLPSALDARLNEVSETIRLKKSDTMRLALEQGLPRLLELLAPQAKAAVSTEA